MAMHSGAAALANVFQHITEYHIESERFFYADLPTVCRCHSVVTLTNSVAYSESFFFLSIVHLRIDWLLPPEQNMPILLLQSFPVSASKNTVCQ